MRIATLFLLCLTLSTLAAPDSLRSQMMDWMDVEGQSIVYGPSGSVYFYQSTKLWDLAMGDSFLVWLPGTDIYYFVNPLNQTEVETLYSLDFGSANVTGADFDDSVGYLVGGGSINGFVYSGGYIGTTDHIWIPGANFYYAEIEDTFLYATSWGDLYCINIADPETLFVARILDSYPAIEPTPLEGNVYGTGVDVVDAYGDYSTYRNCVTMAKADMVNSAEPELDSVVTLPNRAGGYLSVADSFLFYVDTYLSDWDVETETGYNLGSTRLGVWGYDYTYTWSEPDDELSFGVDVLNEYILAVGFEHGFSILDYSDLDDIYEVAYYRDTDSIFAFTHFALKETRLFAVAHPRTDICRLYMFELDSTIWTGISETSDNKGLQPLAFEISSWPNPFNSAVTIAIDGVGDGSPVPVSVEIYDVNGRIVERIPPSPPLTRGEEERKSPLSKGDLGGLFVWHPAPSLPSGVYLLRATIPGNKGLQPLVSTKRIVYLK